MIKITVTTDGVPTVLHYPTDTAAQIFLEKLAEDHKAHPLLHGQDEINRCNYEIDRLGWDRLAMLKRDYYQNKIREQLRQRAQRVRDERTAGPIRPLQVLIETI